MQHDFCKICDPRFQYKDCICCSNFKEFENIKSNIQTNIKCNNFNIIKTWDVSTITACCSFNSEIDILKYIDRYSSKNDNKKPFYNCANVYITVKYQAKPRVSAKIFSNGNIQLAGVLNPMSITYAIRKLFKRLQDLNSFKSTSIISNVRICMINSDFKIDKNIKQSFLCKLMDQSNIKNVKTYSFNPNKYPGVNIKMKCEESPKIMSCIIFRPGSVIITGGNDINSYEKIFKSIIETFNEYGEDIFTTPQ